MMKFLLISNMYPSPDSPGYGIFVRNVAEGLEDNGIKVAKKAVISGRSKGRWNKVCKYLKFFSDTIRGFFSEYDFIYVHFPNQIIPLLRVLYKFRQPKIIVNFHGEDLLYSSSGVHKWLGQSTESFCRKYASGIVVPSPYFAKIVESRNIAKSERIIVSASGGINKGIFSPKNSAIIEHATNQPVHLGYIGRLDPGKGIMEFLQVMKRLAEKSISYKATIVGYGSLVETTEKFIKENNLSELITYIPGVPQAQLASHYQSLDILLFLSSGESLGLTGLESLACGTPVIGSKAGGIASYLSDGKNGYMISDIYDTDSIVEVIKEYVRATKEYRLEMYDNAVATGVRYHSDNVCQKLASDLKGVLSNGKV